MGAVCAVVYLFTLLVFIPFPFYKDIVAATSGGGNRDIILQVQEVETGRFLHRFPHSKVGLQTPATLSAVLTLSSLRRTCLPFSPFSPSFSWALAMICSTSAGATRSLFPPSLPFPCSPSTLSTLASPRSSYQPRCDPTSAYSLI